MRSFLTRLLVVLALIAIPLAVVGATTGASAKPVAPSASQSASSSVANINPAHPYVLKDGLTSPVYSYKNAIRESVWVTAPDGDAITADIIRPRELDHKATVPVIMDASPYYLCCGRGNQLQTKTYAKNGEIRDLPLYYDNYFEPRGYAVVEVDMAGTARSTGCSDEGASQDVNSIKAVIDWLNGRAKAVDVKGNPVTAYWANGKVGMIGKSYDGTLANAVAATGVKGLVTVVPISAISSWYDYDRSQGLPFSYNYPAYLSETVESDRTKQVDCSAVNASMDKHDADSTGAYTKFWSNRDYRNSPAPSANKVHASVFLVHGLQDTNVKTVNFGDWYKLLIQNHVTVKVWLSRLGHTDPFDYRRAVWVKTLHEWFDSQLMGIKDGILDQPRINVEIQPHHWVTSNTWPVSNNQQQLTFHSDGSLTTGAAGTGTATFTNSASQSEAQAIEQGTNGNRLLYLSGTLTKTLRISGQPTVSLDVTPKGSTAQIGVALVDYGTHNRVVDDGEGNKTLTTSSCWGKSTSYDSACYYNSVENIKSSPLIVLARGWARLVGGQENTITVDLAYQDTTIPAGDQIGLAIFGASPDWVVTIDKGSEPYSVNLATSSLTLPMVGNLQTDDNAGYMGQVPTHIPAGTLPDPSAPQNRLPI